METIELRTLPVASLQARLEALEEEVELLRVVLRQRLRQEWVRARGKGKRSQRHGEPAQAAS